MAKSASMPDGHLHAVVDAIAATGSQQLARRAAEGAPVPFDLVEVPSSGDGAPLFSYRPRTRDFVEEHSGSLRQLMAWSTAVNVLAGFDGLGDYLLTNGERHVPIDARERADLVLRVLLAKMHEDTGDFVHTPARSAAAANSLARCLLAGRVEGTVVVPLLGVRLDEERLKLEDGLELVRDDAVEGLPREARSPVRNRPGTVVVVSSLEDPARAAALAQARPRLRALLTALRLYGEPSPALAPVAWSRMRGDGWASHPFIGTSARATGTLHITAQDTAAIRGFCSLMAERAPNQGTAGWAMRRFELACERPDHAESLTDALLGLRALLEADQLGSGALAERLAALCAAPGEWHALRDRVQIAEALEIALMQGTTTDPTRTRTLSLELRAHLRALLRDMACGHLPADLVEVAEQHLAQDDFDPHLLDSSASHAVVVTDTRPAAPTPAPAVAFEADEYAVSASADPSSPSGYEAPSITPIDSGAVAEPYATGSHAAAPHVGPEITASQPALVPARRSGRRPFKPAAPVESARPSQGMPEGNSVPWAHEHPRATDPRSADARALTADGESFEAAFVRSLTDGPSPR